MEELYRLDPTLSCSNGIASVESYPGGGNFMASAISGFHSNPVGNLLQFEAAVNHKQQATGSDMCDLIKAQIANHPRYPDLLSAYIECQKVGAPPEIASLLEEIGRENCHINTCSGMGADPELDQFMESYCEVLHRYKEEISKPFDEATMFFSNIELQLSSLCKGTSTKASDYASVDDEMNERWSGVEAIFEPKAPLLPLYEGAGTSEEELSCGEVEVSESQESSGGCNDGQNLKGMLLRKYSGYLSNLRKEFLKKRKKGKLPKDARAALLDWWNNHYRWPYPTEEEKVKLSEITGLDQKQINNWFINQRKRHWKPSEDMRFALIESVSGSAAGASSYLDTGGDDV